MSKWYSGVKVEVLSRDGQLERKVQAPRGGEWCERQRKCTPHSYEYWILSTPYRIHNGFGNLQVAKEGQQTAVRWKISFDFDNEVGIVEQAEIRSSLRMFLQDGLNALKDVVKAIPAEVATFMTTTNGTIVPSVPFELGIPPPAPMGLKGAPKKRGEIEWNWQKRFPLQRKNRSSDVLIDLEWHQNFLAFCLQSGVFQLKEQYIAKLDHKVPYVFNPDMFASGLAMRIVGDALAQAVMVMKIEFDMIYGGEFGLPYVGAAAAFLAESGKDRPYCWTVQDASQPMGLSP
jgi:hypothetical protein